MEEGRGEGDLSEKSRDWALVSRDQREGTNRKLSLTIEREGAGDGVGECELNFKNLLLLSNYSVKGQAPCLASLTPGSFLLISQS